MNKAPNITDPSHGMWRRIMVIDFPKIITEEEMDRELEMKLAQELSGIFNWAIEGYRRLKERSFRFLEPQSVSFSKKSYREETDSVRAFVNTFLVKSNDDNDQTGRFQPKINKRKGNSPFQIWKNSFFPDSDWASFPLIKF